MLLILLSLNKFEKDNSVELSDISRESLGDNFKIGGIRITDNYALQILDDDGIPCEDPSNAFTEFLTISLIYGLQKTANKSGPVIIDNPLQHFDEDNRPFVLKFFPKMGEQVVLLMHSGEYRREYFDKVIGDKIGSEYKIHNKNINSSRFERIR